MLPIGIAFLPRSRRPRFGDGRKIIANSVRWRAGLVSPMRRIVRKWDESIVNGVSGMAHALRFRIKELAYILQLTMLDTSQKS